MLSTCFAAFPPLCGPTHPKSSQSKIDALNLTQINEFTRYNPKSVNTGTLIDILTNSLYKYTSAVFNQDLSNHCFIACICNGLR
jgi:ABC-type oligopeptide transport system substrate-binding subunit